jgi:hypothetical protein
MSDTDYPAVRRVMGEHRHRLDDDALESVLEELFPDSDPADVESFMGTIQRFGKEVAPIAQRALPGAVQGAMTGSSMGLYGALAGAALGATGAALSAPQGPSMLVAPATPTAPVQPPATPVQSPPTPAQPPAPTPVQSPPTPAQPPASTPGLPMTPQAAASALLEILTNRATFEALLAVLMEAAGRSTVKVGDKDVPPAAFANAISEFAAIAAESDTGAEATTDYLYGDSGWPRGDLASPLERAEILLSDVREAARDDEIPLSAYEEIPLSAYERVAYGWRTDD